MICTAVIADDSPLLRAGIGKVLIEGGIDVLAEALDATQLLAVVEAQSPDIAIVDIRMPPHFRTEGLDAAARIRRDYPSTSVLLLSQYVDTENAIDLLTPGTGSIGYLLKDRVVDVDDFVATVIRVAQGDTAIDPQVISAMLGKPRRQRLPLDDLTDRERSVLELMAQGHANAAIASRLHLGERTVESHINNIFSKLQLPPDQRTHRRVIAVLTYLRNLA